MPHINNFAEAEAALQPYVPLVGQLTGKDTTLERIEPLMKLAGNPERELKIIHIAGTSGKTSTAYYAAALLQAGGQKVGLTVSPHVDSITERVQINGQPLPEAEFCREIEEFLKIVEQTEQPPSYFELLYAFALWVFARHKVDYAVVETGMGGLYDATNVAARPDKVCVITDIGLDHMHILGHTIPEITAQKIGIVHPGNTVLMYEQAPAVMTVVREWLAKQPGAQLLPTNEDIQRADSPVLLDGSPLYQQRNWLLAAYAYKFVANRDKLPHLTSQVLQDTLLVQVPGRMDTQTINGKTIVMDGAHNEQKMTAFTKSFKKCYPGIKPTILIALKTGKEFQAVVPLLAPLASRVIVTAFKTSQDLPAVSMDPDQLAKAFEKAGAKNVSVIPGLQAAYAKLIEQTDKVGIVTGSFYLLSQARRIAV